MPNNPEVRTIKWGDPALRGLGADSFPTYFPSTQVALEAMPGVVGVIRELGGKPMSVPESKNMDQEQFNEEVEKIIKVRDDARFRKKALLIAALGTTAAVLATHFILHRKK